MTGIVRVWHRAKRFGKVSGADRRAYFVHVDDLIDLLHLEPGQRVIFDPAELPRGPRAQAVQLRAEGS